MKRVLFTISFFFFLAIGLKAQRTIVICGDLDSAIANQKVWIKFSTNNPSCSVNDSTTTDVNGNYSYSITKNASCFNSTSYIDVSIIDCNKDTVLKVFPFITINVDTVKINFKYCCGVRADFSYKDSSQTLQFTNLSTPAHEYEWDFGNGHISRLVNPKSSFSSPGFYNVRLCVTDTIKKCTRCKTKLIHVKSPCLNFKASFSAIGNVFSVKFFSNSFGGANKFLWNFGDGGGYMQLSDTPTHNYNSFGRYNVCLIAQDTIGGCSDTFCTDVMTGTRKCTNFRADFSYRVACDTVHFTNTSSNTANFYYWDLGNGFVDSSHSPSHRYFIPSGTYFISLAILDTITGCVDTVVKQVSFTKSLSGTIFRNNNQMADSGRVWLIKVSVDSLTNDTVLTAIDSTLFIPPNASYNFPNIQEGDYLLKAALLPGAAFYSNRIPTYYVDKTRWDRATSFTVNYWEACVTKNITLKQGNNPGGAGFIGGFVKQGANKTGDPLEKILVILYNDDGSPFGYRYTDINGEYIFDNVVYGDYMVAVDVLGKPSDEYTVTIDANKPKDYDGNFEVNTKDVTLIKKTTHVVKLAKGKLNLYPNPTNSNTAAVFNSNKNGVADIAIMDLTGKTILSWQNNVTLGDNTVAINTNNLTSGLYLVTVKTQNTLYVARLGVTK
jgi:PKD repeat protein